MHKKITSQLAFGLVFALALLTMKGMQGQSAAPPSSPSITTGGDPQPVKPYAVIIPILPMLLGLLAG